MYIEPDVRVEDNRSTAWTFTVVSILGIILLILLDLGILPIPVADEQKVLLTVVMGIMFLIFLCVGINSFLSMGRLKSEAAQEASLEREIRDWFLSEYTDFMKSYHPADDDIDIESEDGMDETDDIDNMNNMNNMNDMDDTGSPEETNDDRSDDEPGTSFYPRYRKMSELITEKYPSLSDEFTDHLIDELYTAIFSE